MPRDGHAAQSRSRGTQFVRPRPNKLRRAKHEHDCRNRTLFTPLGENAPPKATNNEHRKGRHGQHTLKYARYSPSPDLYDSGRNAPPETETTQTPYKPTRGPLAHSLRVQYGTSHYGRLFARKADIKVTLFSATKSISAEHDDSPYDNVARHVAKGNAIN